MLKRFWTVLLIALVISIPAWSQENNQSGRERVISGRTVERIKKNITAPLSLSHIFFVSNKGIMVAKASSLEDGSFKAVVPIGKYKVRIENLGHKGVSLDLDVLKGDVDLGEIVLEKGEELTASTIQSKALVHRSATRITYDVFRDPDKSKINMSKMIARIPGLKIDSSTGTLVFNGSHIKKIKVDDNDNGLINAERQYPMDFITAHYMHKVILVMPGDSEYGNEETFLLIDLEMDLPWGVASEQCLEASSHNVYKPYVDAVVNNPFMGVGVHYQYSFDRKPTLTSGSETEMLLNSSDVAKVEGVSSSWNRQYSHDLKTNLFRDFFHNKVHFNAEIGTSFSSGKSFSESINKKYSIDNSIIEETSTVSHGCTTSPFRLNGSVSLSGFVGKAPDNNSRRKLPVWSIVYTYLDKRSEARNDYSSALQEALTGNSEHRLSALVHKSGIKWHSMRLNYGLNGGCYLRHYENSTSMESSTVGLDYDQKVLFFNSTISADAFRNKLSFRLRLNAEELVNEGTFINDMVESPLDYSAFSVIPSVSVAYLLKRNRFSVGYSQKVLRPNVNQLNPYADYSNPYSIRTGNPDLKDSKINNVSFSFAPEIPVKWMPSLSMSSQYSFSDDNIESVTKTNDDGVSVSSFYNSGHMSSFSVGFFAMQSLTKNISADVGYNYFWNEYRLASGKNNSFRTYHVNASVMMHGKPFDLLVGYMLLPRDISSQTSNAYFDSKLNITLSRYFEKPHIGISVRADDLLYDQGRRKSVIKDENFIRTSYIDNLGRTFTFRVYWRFGAFKNVKSVGVEAYDM